MWLCVFVLQSEPPSSVETTANDMQFPVEVTGANMRHDFKIEQQNLTR